jgi:hypothetical protein
MRFLFVAGALAVIRYAKIHGTKHRPWLTALLARRHTKVAAIALANKIARMTWAIMGGAGNYQAVYHRYQCSDRSWSRVQEQRHYAGRSARLGLSPPPCFRP